MAWHEWAEVQHKAGLRQKECGRCGRWKYPQELSDQHDRLEAQSRKGPVTVITPVCNKCATPNAKVSGGPLFGPSDSTDGLAGKTVTTEK